METRLTEDRRIFESIDRDSLSAIQLQKLNLLLRQILPGNAFYAAKTKGMPTPLKSLDDLSHWPLTSKHELVPDRPTQPARHLTFQPECYVRFHRTSGTHGHPLAILDTTEDWQWWIGTWQFVLDVAGVSSHDVAAMAFSFGPFIGFWSAHDALASRGAMVIPCGGLSTVARIRMILDNRATILCCTPSYALHMATVAAQENLPIRESHVRTIIVAGEPGGSVPAVWQRIESDWNANVVDHAGATEIGPWGYAAANHRGLHIVESEFIAEYLRIEDHSPAQPGEVSELVITSLGRVGAPVIRYRTGDLVKRPDLSEGGTNATGFAMLEGGVLGRVDDMMIVRGVNVYPSAIEAILREFPEIQEYRMTVKKAGAMDAIQIEVEDTADDTQRIAAAIQLRLGLQVSVSQVPQNTLPRFELKGKRFIDQRDD